AGERLADELGRRRHRLLVRLPAAARPGGARHAHLRDAAHPAPSAGLAADRRSGRSRRRGGAPRRPAARRHLPPHVALHELMLGRRFLLLAPLPIAATARAQSGLWPEWLG